MSILMQVISTVILCNLCLNMGVMFAWPSCTIKIFESANTTLNRAMDENELSLFGSLSAMGSLISTPIMGFGLDRVGRWYCVLGAALSNVIAWTLVACFNYVEIALLAVFISGMSGCVFFVVPLYIAEICDKTIRGAMTSCSILFFSIGLLVSYLLGGYLEYRVMIYACLTISVLWVVLLSFITESPVYLMMKGNEEDARKAIAYYRRAKTFSKVVDNEINTLRRALDPKLDDDSTPETEKLKPTFEQPQEKLSLWKFIKKSRSTQRAMALTLTLMTTSIFQGAVVVQVYAEPLFEEAIPNISPTLCSIIMAIVMIIMGFPAAYLSDVAGRRPLMVYASIGAGVSCLLVGSQLQFHWGPHWVSALWIYLFCAMFTLGGGTVPYVLVAEVFVPEVKSFMSTLVLELTWLCAFFLLYVYITLQAAIGLGPVFYIFGFVCFISAFIAQIWLPETNGVPLDTIQTLFSGKRK